MQNALPTEHTLSFDTFYACTCAKSDFLQCSWPDHHVANFRRESKVLCKKTSLHTEKSSTLPFAFVICGKHVQKRSKKKKKKPAADHFAYIMDTISFFFTFMYLWPLLVKFPKIMQIIFQELIAMQYILPLQYIHVLPLQYIPGHAAHSMLKQQIGSRNSIKIVPTFENSLMQSLLSYFTGNKLRKPS